MKYLTTGNFFGNTSKELRLNGITLTETEYTHEWVDWHYHENAYFTFLLNGKLIEGNKKEKIIYTPGSLLYHNCEEPHYNIKPRGYAKGFHIELNSCWFETLQIPDCKSKGSLIIENPAVLKTMNVIVSGFRTKNYGADLLIEELIISVLDNIFTNGGPAHAQCRKPNWVKAARELLHDNFTQNLSLEFLGNELGVHPVHLSRSFRKYFNCTVSGYISKLKLQKSLQLVSNKNIKLTEIAYLCGYADQSHFLRNFKKLTGLAPSSYRKKFLKC